MKLYWFPGACSLSPHIVARELGLPIELERVDRRTKRTSRDRDFLAINPKGYVPVLELDDGQVLTEGPVIVQYLADLKPDAGLAPPNGTFERVRLQETLAFISSEIHKSYGPLFDAKTPAESRAEREQYLRKRYAILEQQLEGKMFLFGGRFTVADAYLFTVTNWSRYVKLDLSAFPNLLAFQARVAQRPAVKEAMAAEGLNK
jgi:glutathione S-transferase